MKLVIFSILILFSAVNVVAQTPTPAPERKATVESRSQFQHELMRRIVVFPMKADAGNEAAAEEAWWQTREEFTKSRRFLVASKQFLVKSDVYQPRFELEPADSIILGKLLDAHGLVTMELANRQITMSVYDGGNGLLLWKRALGLHPSVSVTDQLPGLARRLVNDFVASIPYQGFTVVDSLIGQAVYPEGDMRLARVDFGVTSGAQVGDTVQWLQISSTTAAPLFQGGSKLSVYAEGRILRIEDGVASVQVTRATRMKDIKEYSLVRVPREADRLQSEYKISDLPRATLTSELVSPEARPMERVEKERRPLVTALSFVGSIAAFLLLAF